MEINGLPLHPLAVHAAVIFGPLGGLCALVYVLAPPRRDRLRWPMLGLALLAGASIVVAYLTGGSFLESRPQLKALPLVQLHQERAARLLWVTIAFSVVAAAAALFHTRTGPVRVALSVLLGLLAAAVLVQVILTGDAGARAVWGQ